MTNHTTHSTFKTCTSMRKDGQRCSNVAVDGSDRCWFHSDLTTDARAEARAKGGRNHADLRRVDKLLPETLRASIAMTVRAMRDVANGTLDPARGSSVAALGSSLVRQYEAGLRAEQLGSIEAMLTAGDTPPRTNEEDADAIAGQ